MAHIHTEPGQHDTTSSAVIIRLDDGESKAMVHMHRKLGVLMQFGGHVELHENPWQTITHELREESGYDLDQLDILQPKLRITQKAAHGAHPYPIMLHTHPIGDEGHFHSDICFAFVTDQAPRHRPEDGESEEIKLLSLSELKALPSTAIPEDVRQMYLFAIESCLDQWERIPAETVA